MFVESLIFFRAPRQSWSMVFGSSAVQPLTVWLAFTVQEFHANFKRTISLFAFKKPVSSGS